MSSVTDAGEIPSEGKNLIIVAAVNQVLHFRIFNHDGKMAADTDSTRLTEKARPIEDLREQLANLWPPHKLTGSEKGQVIDAVTSIVGHTSSISPTAADKEDNRIWEVVVRSAGLPMERLGKPCWFSKPKAVPVKADTPCSYVLSGGKVNEIPWLSPEKDLPRKPDEDYRPPDHVGEVKLNESAYREWMEWKFVHCLDEYVKRTSIVAMIDKVKQWKDEKGLRKKWEELVKEASSTGDRADRTWESNWQEWRDACDRWAKCEEPLTVWSGSIYIASINTKIDGN
jgi:hypothetical protein